MLFGQMPFMPKDEVELKKMVKLNSGDNTSFPSNVKVSKKSKNLIKKLLQLNPEKRLNWDDFFNHDVFS